MGVYWVAPSGRIHLNQRCSGNGKPRETKRHRLTREELGSALESDMVCRCARMAVRHELEG